MQYTVGIDIGYGDVKAVIGKNGVIIYQFKFSSAIAIAKKVSAIRDTRIIELTKPDGTSDMVYVGLEALELPSSSIVDISNYEMLETYAPVFVYKVLQLASIKPEEVRVLVSGLSVTQLTQSGYFKERIKDFTINGENFKFNQVFLLPQGAGSKMTFDKYGSEFPDLRTESSQHTFVGCDIGFNTLDMYYVTNGKTSPNLFEGIQQEGVMRIANLVREEVKKRHQREITLREAKSVLDSKVYKLRGQVYDMQEVVKGAVDGYRKRLFDLIEEKYGPVIDKCDFICLQGGGAMLCETDDPFFRVVKKSPDFYNAIGFYLYGETK